MMMMVRLMSEFEWPCHNATSIALRPPRSFGLKLLQTFKLVWMIFQPLDIISDRLPRRSWFVGEVPTGSFDVQGALDPSPVLCEISRTYLVLKMGNELFDNFADVNWRQT